MFASDSDFDEEFLETVLSGKQPGIDVSSGRHQVHPPKLGFTHDYVSVTHNSEHPGDCIETDFGVKNKQSCTLVEQRFSDISSFSRSVERKFPGPAGLLPDKGNAAPPDNSDPKSTAADSDNVSSKKEQHTLQTWQSMLESETWKRLLIDLRKVDPDGNLLKNINIKSVKNKASARLLVTQKIPFLAVILQDVSSASPDPYITLCDQTGIMNGTMHRNAWKQFGEELVPGCVLLLRNVGVLSFGIKSYKNQHYLNITSNNLVSLYTHQEGRVQIMNVTQFSAEEPLKSVEEWHSNTTPSSKPDQSFNQSPQQLFQSPFTKGSKILKNSSSGLESSRHPSPHYSQSPQFNSPSLSLSLKSNAMKEINSNGSSMADTHHVSQNQLHSGSPLSTRSSDFVLNKREVLGCNQFSVRDSSAILNLISSDDNSECKVVSVESRINLPAEDHSEVTKTCNRATDSSRTLNSSKHHVGKKFADKLSKFSFNQSSDNTKNNLRQNSFSTSCKINENSSEISTLLREQCDNNVLKNIFNSKQNENISCFNFKPKKPRTESQDSFNADGDQDLSCIENFDEHRLIGSSILSGKLKFSGKNTDNNSSKCILSNSSTISCIGEPNFEQSQVETALEGLDASCFLDDF